MSKSKSVAKKAVGNAVNNGAEKNVEKSVDADVSVLLTNRNGSYSLFSSKPLSRYEGVFFRHENKMFKVIESFSFASPVSAITNHLWGVTLKRGDLSQLIFMPINRDAVVVSLSASSEFELVLDAKISEDNRVWGRNYCVSHEDKTIVVKFSKKSDCRDDNSLINHEFDLYLAVYAPELEYLPLQSWEEHNYHYDEERNSPPFSRWVFKACKIRVKDFVCAWSFNKSDAVDSAKKIFDERDRLRRECEIKVNNLVSTIPKTNNSEISLAYQCSINALDSLMIGDGVIAGLPWFYQFWARDEIICAKAFMLQKNLLLSKKILFRYFEKITKEGLLPNLRNHETNLLSADAIAWLFFRINELLSFSAKKNVVSKKEKDLIVEKLQSSLFGIIKSRLKNNLIQTNGKETWMDTDFGNDGREGAAIEVQAMVLFMLKMLRKLTGKKDFVESDIISAVKKNFVKGKLLSDVAGKQTIRPNIFIAAYFYPELFSQKEWESFFDFALPRLWLDWGGISSIDKKHELFKDVYTGENNQSYHRGDSWFWLNNLCAIVLNRINVNKYSQFVKKILEASTCEILYKGATGFAAELSSAKELSSKGCVAQSWSSALYIELVCELSGK